MSIVANFITTKLRPMAYKTNKAGSRFEELTLNPDESAIKKALVGSN